MQSNLAAKQVECACGNSFTTQKFKSWCEKCCRPVFYHEKDKRKHQLNTYYVITMLVMVLMFITYLFVEMIAEPMMTL